MLEFQVDGFKRSPTLNVTQIQNQLKKTIQKTNKTVWAKGINTNTLQRNLNGELKKCFNKHQLESVSMKRLNILILAIFSHSTAKPFQICQIGHGPPK